MDIYRHEQRQRYRQTGTYINTWTRTDRGIQRQIQREGDVQRHIHTDRQGHTETPRYKETGTYRDTYTQADMDRDT